MKLFFVLLAGAGAPAFAQSEPRLEAAEAALAQLQTFAAAECDTDSENASCRGSGFGTSCITKGYVTGECVPYGGKNIYGNYLCSCR